MIKTTNDSYLLRLIKDAKMKDKPSGIPLKVEPSHIVYTDRENLNQLERKLNSYFNESIVKGIKLTANTIELIREDYKADIKQVKTDPQLKGKENEVKAHYSEYQKIVDKVLQHYAATNPSSDIWRQVDHYASGSHKIVDAQMKDEDTLDTIVNDIVNTIKNNNFTMGGYKFSYTSPKVKKSSYKIEVYFDLLWPNELDKLYKKDRDKYDDWDYEYGDEVMGANGKGTAQLDRKLEKFETRLKKLGYKFDRDPGDVIFDTVSIYSSTFVLSIIKR